MQLAFMTIQCHMVKLFCFNTHCHCHLQDEEGKCNANQWHCNRVITWRTKPLWMPDLHDISNIITCFWILSIISYFHITHNVWQIGSNSTCWLKGGDTPTQPILTGTILNHYSSQPFQLIGTITPPILCFHFWNTGMTNSRNLVC